MSHGWPDCKHATYTDGQLTNRQKRYSAPFTCQIHPQTQVPLPLALWWRIAEKPTKLAGGAAHRSPHLLDHLGISVDGQFERLNRLRVLPDLNRRSISRTLVEQWWRLCARR